MCSVAAIFGKNIDGKDELLKSLERVAHRGTNLYEYKAFPNAILGANRLPIVGRAHGQQPIANEDGTVFAVQNGEVFNYRILRSELEVLGHTFATDSDTEVLVHLYEEFGEKMIEHIDSEMYAFIIYNSKEDTFFVARDRFGVKPLYYGIDKAGRYHFGSELKQLASNEALSVVKKFPPAHYMKNGKLKSYFSPVSTNEISDPRVAKRELTRLIVEAVRKRVDTDLPIAVLLSGGVDSSLIMEIANRLHPDVTAFILGSPGAPDYEAAVRLCREYNYKYRVVTPDVDYGEEVDDVIYHLETYEAQVIRQAFALDSISRAVVRAGFRVALVGDASDEIFAGYNEFASLREEKVNEGCLKMVLNLANGHNQRLDRMTMKHTLEARVPFLDTQVVEYALRIDGSLKIKRDNHRITTKYILRLVAEDFLPHYIASRYKVPFSNGAGMNVGFNFRSQDGDVAEAVLKKERRPVQKAVNDRYGLVTDEERYYFQKYRDFTFEKLEKSWHRIITKDNLRDIEVSPVTKLLVAEFDKLPIYYPIYHAWRLNLFKKHNIEVDFISTGGDDLTYNSLLNNSAQIGLADPVFSYAGNKTSLGGKIVGELVDKVPLLAVAVRPDVLASNLTELGQYRIGTFQKFTTTHTITKYLLPDANIQALDYKQLFASLSNKQVDVAVMIPEFAEEVLARGGHIVYDFEPEFNTFLFSGFTVSGNIEERFEKSVTPFLASIKEAIRDINNNSDRSLVHFKQEFPELTNPERIFSYYQGMWSKTLKIKPSAVNKAKHVWHTVYPWLLRANTPQFMEPGIEEEVLKLLVSKRYSRDVPYREDDIRQHIRTAMQKKMPLQLLGFWGASDKESVDIVDTEAIQQLESLRNDICSIYKPGVEISLILSDEHARLNGFHKDQYQNYLRDIAKILKKTKIQYTMLSVLWRRWKIRPDIIQIQHRKQEQQNKYWWDDISIKNELEASAKKLVRGKGYKKSAQRYFIMRSLEAEHLKKDNKKSIFFTYSSDNYQMLLPDMATLYLWVKKGTSHAPWFSNQD